jgi:hypothetical protein
MGYPIQNQRRASRPIAMSNLLRRFLPRRIENVEDVNEQYQRRGYHLFRAAFPREQVGTLADLVRSSIPSYKGTIRRSNGELEINDFYPGTPHIRNSPLNLHFSAPEGLGAISDSLRALVTSPGLAELLQKLDAADHYTIHQTILFITTPTTELHIDSFSLDTAPRGFAHTVWIPLQDMDISSGVPCVVPWPQAKLITEAELGLAGDGTASERYEPYQLALAKKIYDARSEAVMPLMRAGDFVVWSPLTPHFTAPSRPWPKERLALQVLIRPTHCTWGTFFNQPSKWTVDRAVRVSDRFSLLEV